MCLITSVSLFLNVDSPALNMDGRFLIFIDLMIL